MSIAVNKNWVMESLRESKPEFIIVDNLTNYDKEYKSFWNVFWAGYRDTLLDNSIELESA